MEKFSPTKFSLLCVATGEVFEDNGWSLDYPTCRKPSLIRTQYAKRQLSHVKNPLIGKDPDAGKD